MSNVTLTENEIVALKACLNYDDRETQKIDNYSNAGAEEFRAELNWSNHQVAGLISSLEAKGMGDMDEQDDIFWLSDLGIDTIFDIIDSEKESEEDSDSDESDDEMPMTRVEFKMLMKAMMIEMSASLENQTVYTDGASRSALSYAADAFTNMIEEIDDIVKTTLDEETK